jgi:mono/diheme cytochrome c family protein
MKKVLVILVIFVFIALVGGFLLLQLIPYGHNHTNPAVISEPKWDSPQTRSLLKQACFDCHSNETVWPWYSNIAPASWLIQKDVEEGRAELNFSEWDTQTVEIEEILEHIEDNHMPPSQYTLIHSEARLTQEQRNLLVQGLQNSLYKP